MSNYEIGGRVEIIQGALLKEKGSNNAQFYAEFRNTLSVAGADVARYRVEINADIRNVVENEDSSITLDFYGISSYRAYTTFANQSTSVPLTYSLDVDKANNGTLSRAWTLEGELSHPFDSGLIHVDTEGTKAIKVTIPAGQSVAIPERKVAHWLANAPSISDEFNVYVGGSITNTNPPLYTPMAVRDGGKMKSNNKNGKNNKVRLGKTLTTIAKENYATVSQPNKGHMRIRDAGSMKQQTIIGE